MVLQWFQWGSLWFSNHYTNTQKQDDREKSVENQPFPSMLVTGSGGLLFLFYAERDFHGTYNTFLALGAARLAQESNR